MFVLDTNCIIYYLEAEPEVSDLLEKIFLTNNIVYISAITELELFAYPAIRYDHEQRIEKFLKLVTTLTIESNLARNAARVKREFGLQLADSIIAATALATGSILLTRNIKDFKRIPNLKLQKI